VVLATGVALAVRALQRLLPAGTLQAAAGMPAAIAALAVMSAAFFGAEVYVPLALTTVRAQSTVMAGVALTAATLCWTAGTWIQSRIVTRWGYRTLTVLGLMLMVVGIGGTAAVLIPSVDVLTAPVMWGIAGLGMGIAYPTATLVALGSAPAGREGEASASMQLANVLGMAVGTGVGGGLFSFMTAAGFSMAVAVAIVEVSALGVAIVGIAAALRLPRHSVAVRALASDRGS
jgi:MFS family permease